MRKISFKKQIIGGTFRFSIPMKIDYFEEGDKGAAQATAEIILRDMENSDGQAELVRFLKSRAEKRKENLTPPQT